MSESRTGSSYYITFCVRDGMDSIAQVMDSYINQTFSASKIIVVDDGSTDGTYEILESYKNQFPDLIELLETHSMTRDYSRIPKLWNMGLRRNYDFHMIGAGDAAISPSYAETILKEMCANPKLVICSGDYGSKNSKAPHGGGRFIRQSFFFENYDTYPWILGYESEILERALLNGYQIKVINHLEIIHLDKLGHSHNFKEFGYGMKALGYHPLYALGRIVLIFLRDKNIGKKGALRMLKHYLLFKPQKNGYYSKFPQDIRNAIRERQKQQIQRFLKRTFWHLLGQNQSNTTFSTILIDRSNLIKSSNRSINKEKTSNNTLNEFSKYNRAERI